MKKNKNPDEDYKEKWEEILADSSGNINLKQLKLELADFDDLMDRMSVLTCELTHSRLSYPTYPVETILAVHQEVLDESLELQKKEDKEDGQCSFCGHVFSDGE